MKASSASLTYTTASLSVEHAHDLIRRIALEQEKQDLVDYLYTAEGRYRVRALHYLAGGNHRMYVLLSEFLSRNSLDDLVQAFEDLAEEMTPYFQERMHSLPDQQRQLAQRLYDADGAMTVKAIAQDTFVEERTCVKQLGNLKKSGYVLSLKRGKESYYDIAEPLMRLCLEVKNWRGQPMRMLARFLKAWFPLRALSDTGALVSDDARAGEYRKLATQLPNTYATTLAANLHAEISTRIQDDLYDEALNLVQELEFADPAGALHMRGVIQSRQEYFAPELADFTAVIEKRAADFSGLPVIMLHMVLQRPASDWRSYCAGIAELYLVNELADTLGQGLTASIKTLDQGDFTDAQLAQWQTIWHEIGDGCDGLQIPLRCLDAAVAVMMMRPPSDVPLLKLPPEIRKLIRSLLNATLGRE